MRESEVLATFTQLQKEHEKNHNGYKSSMYEVVITALKREEAVKPKRITVKFPKRRLCIRPWVCPVCEHEMHPKARYCWYCGQKLEDVEC